MVAAAGNVLGVFRLDLIRFMFQFCRGRLVLDQFFFLVLVSWNKPLSGDAPIFGGIVLTKHNAGRLGSQRKS